VAMTGLATPAAKQLVPFLPNSRCGRALSAQAGSGADIQAG